MQLLFMDLLSNNGGAGGRETEVKELNDREQTREPDPETENREPEQHKAGEPEHGTRNALRPRRSSRTTVSETDLQQSIAAQVASSAKSKKKKRTPVQHLGSSSESEGDGSTVMTVAEIVLHIGICPVTPPSPRLRLRYDARSVCVCVCVCRVHRYFSTRPPKHTAKKTHFKAMPDHKLVLRFAGAKPSLYPSRLDVHR